ncbi:glutamate--tRNA ligase, chloroplastic/mitochondrial-like isoform X2 [Euphorbia lathyris]
MPSFAHVSLILAPDQSNCQNDMVQLQLVREIGYLPQGMVNYLALLGCGDDTENEFSTLEQLVEKFSIDCVNKSGAIFDSTKLRLLFVRQRLECLAMPCLFESGIRLELLYRMLMHIVYQYVNPSYCVTDVMHLLFLLSELKWNSIL